MIFRAVVLCLCCLLIRPALAADVIEYQYYNSGFGTEGSWSTDRGAAGASWQAAEAARWASKERGCVAPATTDLKYGKAYSIVNGTSVYNSWYTLHTTTTSGSECQIVSTSTQIYSGDYRTRVYVPPTCAAGSTLTKSFGVGWASSSTESNPPPSTTPPASYCDGQCSAGLDEVIDCYVATDPGPNGHFELTCDVRYVRTGQACGEQTPDPENPEPAAGGDGDPDPPNCADGTDPACGNGEGDGNGGNGDGDGDGGGGDGDSGGGDGDSGEGEGEGNGNGTGQTGGTEACTQAEIDTGMCSCTTPEGQPSKCTMGGGGNGNGSGDDKESEDCKSGSNLIGCSTLDGVPEADGIKRENKPMTWTPDNILGTSASCPPDKTVSIGGRTFSFTNMPWVCSLLGSYVKPMAILLASFFAVMIVAGATKDA